MSKATWQIDTTHTTIGFTVRHMVVAKVHGRFTRFEGKLSADEKDLTQASAEVKIEAASIDTGVGDRDNHLRSDDFLGVEKHTHITFRSKKIEAAGKDRFRVVGDLTIRGTTREVVLDTEYLGRMKDPFGEERIAFSAKTSIERKDFGLTWNQMIETGGVLVGDRVEIGIDLQAVLPATQTQAA